MVVDKLFNSQRDEYSEPRSETDRDLVGEVRQQLMFAGRGQNLEVLFDQNHYIQEAMRKKPEVQRYLLNKYWNLQMLQVPAPSMEERYCLVPNGPLDDWLRLFKYKVIPFIVQHELPKGAAGG